MTFMMRHNNQVTKQNPKDVCLVHQAEISLDGSILIATDAGSVINRANISRTSNNNVRFSRCKVDGHLKPILSTGSFKGRVLEGAVAPPVVDRLQTTPRLGRVRAEGDRRTETILGMFTKSGSTGQIGAEDDSNSDRRRDADFGIHVVDTEVGLASDRSNGMHIKTNVGDDLIVSSSPPQASLEYDPEVGLMNDGSNGVHIQTNIGDDLTDLFSQPQASLEINPELRSLVGDRSNAVHIKTNIGEGLKSESSPPQVSLEHNPEEAVRVDLHNLHKKIQITEQGTQDEATTESLLDKVSTNFETSSSGILASTESDTSVACVTDQSHDVFHLTNNSGQGKSLELLASSTEETHSDSVIDAN